MEFTREELAGLSEEQLEAYREGDRFIVPIELPTTQALQAQLERPESRRKLFDASRARGIESNRELIVESARLRKERAQLLGFASHADYVIAEETAGSAAAARALITDLAPAAAANAEMERKLASELAGEELDGADWPYWQARRRAEELSVDEAELRKYFPLEQVLLSLIHI